MSNKKMWIKELQKIQLEKFGKKLPKKWKKLKKKRVYKGIEVSYYRILNYMKKAKDNFKERNFEEAHRFAKLAEEEYLEGVPNRVAQIEAEEAERQQRIADEQEEKRIAEENRKISEEYQRQLAGYKAERQKHLKPVCGKDLDCIYAAVEECLPRKAQVKWRSTAGGGKALAGYEVTTSVQVKGKTDNMCSIYFRHEGSNPLPYDFEELKRIYDVTLEDIKQDTTPPPGTIGSDGTCQFNMDVMSQFGKGEALFALQDLKKEIGYFPDFFRNLKINYPSCNGTIFEVE